MAHDHLPPARRPSEGDGYDAPHGWDMAIDLLPEDLLPERFGSDLLEAGDASIEWSSEGALARALLSAALTDAAPSGARERVLSAVDAVLREPVAVAAFRADAAPVTTLSGVFEKRRPTTEAASCTDVPRSDAARSDAARSDAVEGAVPHDGRELDGADPRVEPHAVEPSAAREGVASHEPAPVGAVSANPVSASPVSANPVSANPVSAGDACFEQALVARTPEVVPLERVAREVAPLDVAPPDVAPLHVAALHPAAPEPASLVAPPLSATAASGAHCCGGPMVGGRCRSKAHAVDTAVNRTVNPVTTPLSRRRFRVAVASPGASGAFVPARKLPAFNVAVASNLDAALTAGERSTSARLRDGVVASAFNLAQLAAAIVVGIVIGKAAHLVMAEDSALAWSPTSGAEGGLRAEPSRTPDAVRVSDRVEAAAPPGGIEARSARSTRRPRAGSAARGSLRAHASVRGAPAASARAAAPCNLSAQGASATALPAATATVASTFACVPVAGGSSPPQSTNLAALAPAQVAPLSVQLALRSPPPTANRVRPDGVHSDGVHSNNVQSPLAPASDDWLGEQLAILGRAERSLLEDDPESAVRSLDEYKARFPDGLLDPQMASIRQRVEERFTAFIFP